MIRLILLITFLIIFNATNTPQPDELTVEPEETEVEQPISTEAQVKGKTIGSEHNTTSKYDLDADGEIESLYFQNEEIEYGDWKTHIYINGSSKPNLIVPDLLEKNTTHDISKNMRILKLQMSAGGKLVNTILYQYRSGRLIEIPITTESLEPTLNTWNSGGSEFKDLDKDGIKEMLMYQRHYPPEAKRTVETYKFNGKVFQKNGEYEEPMPNVYY